MVTKIKFERDAQRRAGGLLSSGRLGRCWRLVAGLAVGLLACALPTRAANYTWTNTASGTSGYWTNGILWGSASASIYPGYSGDLSVTATNAYLTNNVGSSGFYTNILNFGLTGTIGTLVVSNGNSGQTWLVITNSSANAGVTLTNNNFVLDNGGRLRIDSGGVVSNTTSFTWLGTNGVLYLNNGGTLKTGGVTLGNGVSNVNATVSSLSAAGQAGVWDFRNGGLTVGNGASTGTILTVNGGTLTNLSAFTVGNGSTAFGNSLIISNAALFTQASAQNSIGVNSSNNQVRVLAGGILNLYGNYLFLGGNGGTGIGNSLWVDGGGVASGAVVNVAGTSSFGLQLNTTSNTVSIVNGGLLLGDSTSISGTGNVLNIGGFGAASYSTNSKIGFAGFGNQLNITNAIVWTYAVGTVTSIAGNSNTVTIASNGVWNAGGVNYYMSSTGNVLTINAGVLSNAQIYVGDTATSQGNTLNLLNGGQMFLANLFVGGRGAGSTSNSANIGGLGNSSYLTNGTTTVGPAGDGYNTLTLTNATLVGGASIGKGGSNNTATVLAGGTWNLRGGVLNVGEGLAVSNVMTINAGTVTNGGAVSVGTTAGAMGNTLSLLNGAKLYATSLNIGDTAGNVSNTVNIGGLGSSSLFSNSGSLNIGGAGASGGNNNTLTVTNANLFSGVVSIGTGSSNNTVNVFSNATWNLLGNQGTLGNFASAGNVMTVNGGTITNVVGFFFVGDNGASGNGLTLSNGAGFFGGAINLGNGGVGTTGNYYNVGGFGTRSTVSNASITVGGSGGFNTVTVTNANLWSTGLAVGNGGPSNTVTVLAGVSWNLLKGNIMLAGNAGSASTGNVMTVNAAVLTNVAGVYVGHVANSIGNTLTLSNGAQMYITGLNVGEASGAVSNSATIGGLGNSSVVSNSGGFTVGGPGNAGGSYNTLTITNGALSAMTANCQIGFGSSNNLIQVLASGTLTLGASANLDIGKQVGIGNTLLVDGGGVASGAVVIAGGGLGLGANSNTLTVVNGGLLIDNGLTVNGVGNVVNIGGVGAASYASNAVFNFGQSGFGNQLTLTNATMWLNGGPSIGANGSSNTINVASLAVWNNGGSSFAVGAYAGTGNVMTVNAGVLTNFGVFTVGANSGGAVGNTFNLLNGARMFASQLNIGDTAGNASNSVNVGGLGNSSFLSNGTLTVGSAGAGYNALTVTNATLLSNSGTIGNGSSNNTATVQAGGIWNLQGNTLTVGSSAASTGNMAWVQSGGLLDANGLVTGAGAGNRITNSGGVYQFTGTAAPTITIGAGVGSIAINSGTISFRDVSTGLNLTNNWKGSQLVNMAFSGNNTLWLNNSIATNTLAGGYNFSTLLGASNYYQLALFNGTTAVTGTGLTFSNNAALLVSNTVATFGGVVTNRGVVVLVNSTNTFSSGLVNQGTITNNNNTLLGLLTMNNGTLVIAGGAAQTLASNINLQATGTFDTSGGNLTLAGAVTNVGSLVKIGTGVLTLAATNSYAGGTVLQNGTLLLGNALALSNGTPLTVNGGILDQNGNAIGVSTLNGTGGVISNYGLTVAGGGNYSGVIAGPGSLVNTGTVSTVLILSGTNTYSGGTTISNGALQAANSSALGSGLVTNLAGGALQLNGGVTLGNALTLFGTGVANDGALRNIAGNNSLTNTITLGSAARINVDANQLTLSNIINSGFNLSVGGAGTTVVAQVIGSGSGGLLKDGTGLLSLNGAQTYTGATTVSNGTLAVNGSLYSAGVVNVLSNATLTGSAILGNVTISGGGTIAAGNNGVGTITAAALSLAANSKLAFEFSPGAFDQIIVTNLDGLTVNGGVFNLYKANTTTTFDLMGSYKLIEYAGTLDGAATNLVSVANETSNRQYGFSLNGGWLTLSITSTGGLGWVGSAINNYWSNSVNWAGGQIPQAGDQLIFDGQTGLNNTNDLAAHTQFSGIFFNSTAGAFTLNSNAVDLLSGVVNLSANTQTLNLPLVLAANGLVFDANAGSLVVNGAISETNGSFGLAKSGAYTLTLAGANTYTGGTILNAGTLSVGAISDTGASGISTSGVLTFNGGALQFTGAGAGSTTRGITNIGLAVIDVTNSSARLTLGGVISGANGLLKYGAGTLVLTGANTYVGGTTISTGTVAISADNNLGAAGGALTLGGGTLEATNNFALDRTRDVTLNSPGGTFNVDNNSTFTMGNTIGGAGALTKTGAGTLVLSNAVNNYGGGTVISGGTLALGTDSGASEKDGALSSGGVMITGGSQLRLGGGAATTNSIGNSLTLNSGMIYAVDGVQHLTSTLTVNSGGGTLAAQAGTKDLFLDGVVSGSGALTIYDTGTTTGAGRGLVRFANNNNTYSGTVTITNAGNNGVLSVDTPTALQFATVNDLSGYGNSLVFYQAAAGATTATLGALGGTANIILQTWNTTAGGDPVVTGGAVTLTVGGNSNNTTYAGALGGSGALVKTGAGIMTLAGANANSGGVTVSNGTVLLSGGDNRLFTNGAVTVAGGTLNLGGFTQTNINTFTIAGGVLTNGTVAKSGADYLGQSGTVSATLGGSAGLTKTTTNTLTLNGTQTYTGATTLSNGTLVVNGALFGAGLVNVLSNATLIGNNATLGNVTVGTGGTLVPVNNGIGTLSMGTLTTAAGSLLPFDFTGATNDQFLVTADNGLTVAGGVFALYQSGTTRTFDALGTYNLIGYAGGIGGAGVSAFTVTNTVGNRLYTFDTAGNWVTLTIAGQGISWVGASPISAYWSDTNNWANHIVPTNGIAIFDGNTQTATINDLADHALLGGITFSTDAGAFSLSGLAPGTNVVDLEGAVINLSHNNQTINLPLVLVGAVGGGRTFNASNGAITVNGIISETNYAFSLVKTGTNLLVLTGANTYSGGTVLNAGTLGIGISSMGSTGALGSGTVFIHAGSLVAIGGAQTFNNAVGIVGNFSVGGNQDLTLAGPINLSNATRVITINNTANTFIAGTVSNGALTKAGNGLLTVTGALAYNGVTTINGGTLQLGNGGNTGTINNNATVQDNSALAFDRSDDLSFGNLITGTGDVVQNGTNVVTLSNDGNSYYGRTVINGGVVSVNFLTNGGVASDIGASSSAASNLVLNGGTLQYTGSGATLDRLFTLGDSGGTLSAYGGALNLTNPGALGMTGTVNRTLVLTGNSNGLLAASIGDPTSGQTALLKTGTNLWVLSNTNTYSGLTTINGGTLLLAGALAAQNSTVSNLIEGGLTFTNSASFIVGGLAGSGNLGLTNTSGGSITLSVGNNNSNTTYLGVLSGSGALTKLGNGTLTLTTNQAYLGGTTVSAGTLQLGGLADTLSTNGAIRIAGGTLDLGGLGQFTTNAVTISSGLLTNGTLTKSGADYAGQGGTVAAVLAGEIGLTKTTGGTLILNGANTYTGATLISNGILQVNGQLIATGRVTVASGATLAGNGGTVGNVTVSSGGIVAPGSGGIGSLTLTTLTVTNGSLFNYEFATAANDQLFVTATNGLTINGGAFRLYQEGTTTTFDAPGTYNLISYAGLIQGSGTNNLSIDPTTQTGNRLYTFGTNGGWVTLTIAGQGTAWVGANSALWSDAGNWGDGTTVPTNGFAVFTGNSRLDTTNDLASAQFAGITFDNGAGTFTLNSENPGANIVTLAGAVVNLSSNIQTINLPLLIAGAQGGTFNASNANIIMAGNLTFDSYASGLLKTGPNVLELTGHNSYTQTTTIAGGILRVNAGAFSLNSNLIFTNGVLESRGVMSVTRSVGTGAGSIQWSGSGGFSANGGTLTVDLGGAGGTLVWGASSFVPNGSTLQFSSSQADSTVKFMNALNLNGGVRTIQVDNGTAFVDVDMTGAISGATGSGLIKTGAGLLRLSGNSSFSGALMVDAGTFLLASTLSNTSVFVHSGATVGGTGIFDSALTLASGGILAPGQSGAGLLTVSSLSLSNGFVYDWELGMTATDRVDVTTLSGLNYFGSNHWTLQLGAEPGVSAMAQWQGSGVLTDQFVLFQFNGSAPASLTNAFILGGGGWDASQARVSIVGNQVLLSGLMFNQSFVVIPEPNVLLMWLAGGFTLWAARRRRRNLKLVNEHSTRPRP